MADQTAPQSRAADAKMQLAANKRRGQSLVALIERRKDRITEDSYDIGEALRELLNNTLYAAMRFDTFEELLDARKRSASTALAGRQPSAPYEHRLPLQLHTEPLANDGANLGFEREQLGGRPAAVEDQRGQAREKLQRIHRLVRSNSKLSEVGCLTHGGTEGR